MSMSSKTEVYFIDSNKDGVKSGVFFFTSYEKDTESNIIIKKKLSKSLMIYNEKLSQSLSFGERKKEDSDLKEFFKLHLAFNSTFVCVVFSP